MALFQPTNIYPSSLGELGDGTVDITKPLAVSWQVNGNSAMTAFSLTVCKNDAASTQVYTTGEADGGMSLLWDRLRGKHRAVYPHHSD